MEKLSIAITSYDKPKYLYVCLDGISKLDGRDGMKARVYIDGGISEEVRKLQEEVVAEFDFAESFFSEVNLGILKNTARALHHSCQLSENVFFIEDDHLVRPDLLKKIKETDKDGFFLCLSGATERKDVEYRSKGNVVGSSDFNDLYAWIEDMQYVGKKCPVTGRILNEDNTSYDVVFNIYLHEHNLKTHFVKGIHVAHFGLFGRNYPSGSAEIHKDSQKIFDKMFSGDKSQWRDNIINILNEGAFPVPLRLRLWPAGFAYGGTPLTEVKKPHFATRETLLKEIRGLNLVTPTSIVELNWLYKAGRSAGVKFPGLSIIEAGTLNGVTAMFLTHCNVLKNAPTHIYTVDNYELHEKNELEARSFKQVKKSIKDMGFSDVVTAVKGDDVEFFENFSGETSLIFIDSLHTYGHVKKLLDLAMRIIVKDGMICGHDYCWLEYGVVRAVEKWKQENKDRLCGFGVADKLWWAIVTEPVK